MRAIVVDEPGGVDAMRLGDAPDPVLAADDVLIRVVAAGVNRADLLQRMGFYPPPAGASQVLGLEVAGEVIDIAEGVGRWHRGDHVMALIEGGGYAELAAAPAAQVMRVPQGVDVIEAAGIPEVFITAHDNLFTRARLQHGETVLIHGGAGGVGTAAVQLARDSGCTVIVTAGTDSKLQRSLELGAQHAINHTSEDFVERVQNITDGHGADVILDIIGAAYMQRNVDALAVDGRLVIIGLQGGTDANLDLARANRKRVTVFLTALRSRPAAQKAAIISAFTEDVIPRLESGSVHPVVDRVLPLAHAAAAHRALEQGEVIGKIVLQVAAA